MKQRGTDHVVFAVCGVDVSIAAQQGFGEGLLSVHGSQHEGRLSSMMNTLQIRTSNFKHLFICYCLDVGLVVKQDGGHLWVAVFRCVVQRGLKARPITQDMHTEAETQILNTQTNTSTSTSTTQQQQSAHRSLFVNGVDGCSRVKQHLGDRHAAPVRGSRGSVEGSLPTAVKPQDTPSRPHT